MSLRFFDVAFYSARVTDVWMWDAKDHRTYEILVEALRETAFRNRWFEIFEILPRGRGRLRQELRSRGHHGVKRERTLVSGRKNPGT